MYGSSVYMQKVSVALPHTPLPGNQSSVYMHKRFFAMYGSFFATIYGSSVPLYEGLAALKICIVWLIHVYVYDKFLKRLPECAKERG